MRVEKILYSEAKDGTCEWFKRRYLDCDCKILFESKIIQSKSDSFDTMLSRASLDGGKTWSDWKTDSDEGDKSRNQGAHVMETVDQESIYNHIHGHFIKLSYQAIHIDGYRAASNK